MLRIPRQRTVYTQGNEFISSQGSHALRLLEGVATPTRTCATGLYDATCQDVSATCLALVLTQLGQKLMSNVVEKDPYEFHYYATLVKVACGTKQGWFRGGHYDFPKKGKPDSDVYVCCECDECKTKKETRKLCRDFDKHAGKSGSKWVESIKAVEDNNNKPKQTLKKWIFRQCRMLECSNTMVGQALKVWWPKHQKYAHGTVQSFDSTTFRHKVVYEDGNEEYLWLAIESYIPLGPAGEQKALANGARQSHVQSDAQTARPVSPAKLAPHHTSDALPQQGMSGISRLPLKRQRSEPARADSPVPSQLPVSATPPSLKRLRKGSSTATKALQQSVDKIDNPEASMPADVAGQAAGHSQPLPSHAVSLELPAAPTAACQPASAQHAHTRAQSEKLPKDSPLQSMADEVQRRSAAHQTAQAKPFGVDSQQPSMAVTQQPRATATRTQNSNARLAVQLGNAVLPAYLGGPAPQLSTGHDAADTPAAGEGSGAATKPPVPNSQASQQQSPNANSSDRLYRAIDNGPDHDGLSHQQAKAQNSVVHPAQNRQSQSDVSRSAGSPQSGQPRPLYQIVPAHKSAATYQRKTAHKLASNASPVSFASPAQEAVIAPPLSVQSVGTDGKGMLQQEKAQAGSDAFDPEQQRAKSNRPADTKQTSKDGTQGPWQADMAALQELVDTNSGHVQDTGQHVHTARSQPPPEDSGDLPARQDAEAYDAAIVPLDQQAKRSEVQAAEGLPLAAVRSAHIDTAASQSSTAPDVLQPPPAKDLDIQQNLALVPSTHTATSGSLGGIQRGVDVAQAAAPSYAAQVPIRSILQSSADKQPASRQDTDKLIKQDPGHQTADSGSLSLAAGAKHRRSAAPARSLQDWEALFDKDIVATLSYQDMYDRLTELAKLLSTQLKGAVPALVKLCYGTRANAAEVTRQLFEECCEVLNIMSDAEDFDLDQMKGDLATIFSSVLGVPMLSG